MKISKIIFFMALTAIGAISCKKDNEPKSMAGTWEGKWGVFFETPSNYEKWVLEKNGDLSAYLEDGTLYATGTWEEDGDEIEVNYTDLSFSNKYRYTGTYDEGDDEITGDWIDPENPIIGGKFEMQRK